MFGSLTGINDLREPLHDEVLSTVFRVEGDRLAPVEDRFQEEVLHSEFHPVKSAARRDEWWTTLRGKWFQHKSELEAFLGERQGETRGRLQQRAAATLKREKAAAKQNYEYRLKELQERSRDKGIQQLARALVEERAEAEQLALFEEFEEEARGRVQDIEQQIAVLRRDVEQTREMLTRERDHQLKTLLPKRFQLHEVRVLPLAVEYVIPATAEDLRP